MFKAQEGTFVFGGGGGGTFFEPQKPYNNPTMAQGLLVPGFIKKKNP